MFGAPLDLGVDPGLFELLLQQVDRIVHLGLPLGPVAGDHGGDLRRVFLVHQVAEMPHRHDAGARQHRSHPLRLRRGYRPVAVANEQRKRYLKLRQAPGEFREIPPCQHVEY
jgi:hypothetical protein